MSKKDPTSAVYQYFLHQNRPYSINDVVMNLHKEHGKAAVQKAVDQLVVEGKVVEKVNGKQKVYGVNQSDLPTASEAELAALDNELKALQEQINAKTGILRNKENTLKQLQSTITTEQAVQRISELESEVATLEDRLQKLSNEQELVTKEDKEKIERKHEGSVKEWRKRKRMCLNVLDAILESYPKPKKALFEEVGVETDEEVGAKMPDI